MKTEELLDRAREAAERLGLTDDGSAPLAAIPGLQKLGTMVKDGNGRSFRMRFKVPASSKGETPFEHMTQTEAFRFAAELGIPEPQQVGGFWMSFATITPAHALKMLLKFNLENRNGRTANIERMVRNYKDGNWGVTHQGLALSAKPQYLTRDGQHRLLALIIAAAELADEGDDSGVAVPMYVTLNLSHEAAMFIDGGERRTVSDRAKLAFGLEIDRRWVGWSNRARIGIAPRVAYPDDEVVEWVRKHAGALRAVTSEIGRGAAHITTSPVMGAIVRAYILYGPGTKRDRLMQFIRVLVSGESSSATNKAAMDLRDLLQGNSRSRRRGLKEWEIYVRTEQAIIAFGDKDPLPAGRIPFEEFFPTKKGGFEEAPAEAVETVA